MDPFAFNPENLEHVHKLARALGFALEIHPPAVGPIDRLQTGPHVIHSLIQVRSGDENLTATVVVQTEPAAFCALVARRAVDVLLTHAIR